MNPLETHVRQFCREHNLRLKKGLGQNFLIDQEILETIVEAAEIAHCDHIVEIGPGIGILTKELLRKASKVTAIELDPRLPPLIKEYVAEQGEALTITEGNALQVPFPDTPYKIVANIPYHITSPLLRKSFLPARTERVRSGGESEVAPSSITILIQREVAEKICDTENASLLTILVGLFGKPQIITHVPPSAFLPPPKVDSAVVHISSFETSRADRETIEKVFELAHLAFSQKRKMIRKTIGAFHGGKEHLKALGIDEKRRPQTLSIDEWLSLARRMMESK
jgi:16S rRNA (adenine1518-N6/adenine1519-N6)-dimethyltransferase